jgi:hypothetical protein
MSQPPRTPPASINIQKSNGLMNALVRDEEIHNLRVTPVSGLSVVGTRQRTQMTTVMYSHTVTRIA